MYRNLIPFFRPLSVANIYYLDDYGTPVVWYELVKRFSAYTGACIRVRRSSDNAEQDINFVNNLLDTASLLSFVGAGDGFVTTFYTQVGTDNVTNATATQQPQIISSGALITRNGFVSVKYDGSNDNLKNFSSAFINFTNVSYFSVAQSDTNLGTGIIHAQFDWTINCLRTTLDRNTTKYNLLVNNSSSTQYSSLMSIQRNDSNLRLLSSFIDSSKNMNSFDNGATGSSVTFTGSPYNNGLSLGARGVLYTPTQVLNGSINCFGAYNIDNSANRVAIETIINNYYSIY